MDLFLSPLLALSVFGSQFQISARETHLCAKEERPFSLGGCSSCQSARFKRRGWTGYICVVYAVNDCMQWPSLLPFSCIPGSSHPVAIIPLDLAIPWVNPFPYCSRKGEVTSSQMSLAIGKWKQRDTSVKSQNVKLVESGCGLKICLC